MAYNNLNCQKNNILFYSQAFTDGPRVDIPHSFFVVVVLFWCFFKGVGAWRAGGWNWSKPIKHITLKYGLACDPSRSYLFISMLPRLFLCIPFWNLCYDYLLFLESFEKCKCGHPTLFTVDFSALKLVWIFLHKWWHASNKTSRKSPWGMCIIKKKFAWNSKLFAAK